MATSRRGKRLSEEHRQQQLALRAQFLREFFALWPLMDPTRVDETGQAWIRAVMPLIRQYRDLSADATEDYYRDFRLAEAPTDVLSTPVPTIERTTTRGTTQRRPRQGRPTADPPADTPTPQRGSQRPRRGRLRPVRIVWDDADEAAEKALETNGPRNIKSKTKRGRTADQSARDALADAAGAAGRHVLEGGRHMGLTLVHADDAAIGWIRVTDGDPCGWCAMLASRGPAYRSAQSAQYVVNPKAKRPVGALYHDHCGCTAEAMFDKAQEWPELNRAYRELWNRVAKGQKDPLNAFRREIERQRRERRRSGEAAPETA